MINDIANQTDTAMNESIDAFRKTLASIRTGRANASILDGVRVDYYGSRTALSQLANVTVADATLLTVKPWEKGLLKEIEKAIVEANLGLSPTNDGELVRVPIPSLTEERRKEYVKQAKTKSEDAKIAIRNARRDGNEMMKVAAKEGNVTEDDEKHGLKMIQEKTNAHIKSIDEMVAQKEKDIMSV